MLTRAFLAAVLLCQQAVALHFYLRAGQTQCFFEELPADTLLVGRIDAYQKNYATMTYEKAPNLRVEITVDETFDNMHQVVKQKLAPSGDFTFTSVDLGEHRFCLKPVYTDGDSGSEHRIYFDVATGSALDYADSKNSRRVNELTEDLDVLYRKLSEIHWEQEQLREREAHFRDQSEKTNHRVVKWTIIQLLVLVGTCVYQMRHLKGFFVKQKII